MPERKNILFIHVDQMHWEAMSAYGNPHVNPVAAHHVIGLEME